MIESGTTGVYSIRNTVNGKRYIGSAAKCVTARIRKHRRSLDKGVHPNRHLQAAWNKYGSKNFKITLLERCNSERCLEREQFWIDKHRSADNEYGYNLSPTAGSCLGVKHSEEARAKMAEGQRRRKAEGRSQKPSAVTKAKLSAASKGKPKSQAHREALSRAKTGRKHPHTPEWEAKRVAAVRESVKTRDESYKQTEAYRLLQSARSKAAWARRKNARAGEPQG